MMNRFRYNVCVVLLFLLMSGFVCSKKGNAFPPGNIKAAVYYPSNPILRGLPANPFLRITLTISENGQEAQLQKIHCKLNESSVNDIQKIDIYSGSESFTTDNLVASFSPAASSFDLPIGLTLKPGIYVLWISVVLKNDAAVDNRIDLRCTNITTDGGNNITIDNNELSTSKLPGVALRKAGDDVVNTYRIPGLVTTDKGTLVAVYDIRYNKSSDLPGNIDVGMSRSTDKGETWEPMKVIMDMGAPHENNGVGDPAILFDPKTKKIWVAALWSKGNRSIAGSLPGLSPDTTGQFVLVSSDDDGVTWSAPYSITPQVKNPAWHLFFDGPGSGIVMQDGKLVFAAQYWDEKKMPWSTIIYSEDKGSSWKGKIAGPKSNTTESQVVETTPGTLMLNMRDNRGSFRSVATTTNLGSNWTEHATSYNTLPDPVCQGSLIKAKVNVNGVMKEVLFFSNPNTSSGRYNITIKASLDLGETWLPINQTLIDERQCYGYSSLTKIDDNTIGILYEGVKDLYFVKVPVTEIIK